MSTYANASHPSLFNASPISLSREAHALLAGAAVGVGILGLIAMKDVSQNADFHTNTNFEDVRLELPDSDLPEADSAPWRPQRY